MALSAKVSLLRGLTAGLSAAVMLVLVACGSSDSGAPAAGGEGDGGSGALSEAGDATAASDQSGSGGTLRVAMSAWA